MASTKVRFGPLLDLYSVDRIKKAAKVAGFHNTTVRTMMKRDSLTMWSADKLAKHLGAHVDSIWTDYPVPN